jgi:hypothetical protein
MEKTFHKIEMFISQFNPMKNGFRNQNPKPKKSRLCATSPLSSLIFSLTLAG